VIGPREQVIQERRLFGALLEDWASEYGVTSVLEGPVDGIEGVRGVHAAGLARRGVAVCVAVRTEAEAQAARAVYGETPVDVRVVRDPDAPVGLPRSDMVIAYHALPLVEDWREYLATLGTLATRALVVVLRHPRGAIDRLTGALAPVCRTEVVAPALWEIGRVRTHVHFDAGPLEPIASALAPRLQRRIARMHAFVVDTSPRTPQARRKLKTV
jgi:hypothetical protein